MSHESPGREAKSFAEVLLRRAEASANDTAFVFLRDGEHEEASLTYGELHRGAEAVARELLARGGVDDRAVLLYPPGLDFIVAFFGCLYAGIVPVPVSVPNRRRGFELLLGITQDSGARCLLSSAALLEKLEEDFAREPALRHLPRFDTVAWQHGGQPIGRLTPRQASDVALLQYTSGSTGNPRGVVVTHGNLLANHREHALCFGHDPRTVAVSWLPMFHDMGLGTVLGALWLGVPCITMAPTAFLQKPIRWLRAISRYRATSSGGPDFAYELCVRRISEEECSGLDLSSWRVAYNGSEPVRPATLTRFAEKFGPRGFDATAFHPVYGLAEATLFVSGERFDQAPIVRSFSRERLEQGEGRLEASPAGHELVSCGTTWVNGRMAIVNPDTRELCAPGQIGEIWVNGPSVAAGYWRKPKETAEVFQARLADGSGPYLRTGDLGFVHDARLFVAGRSKDLIIVRGRNHYPQDIEVTVSHAHPALEPLACAAFSVEGEEGEQLVLVQEVKRTSVHRLQAEDVFRAIRGSVADAHGLHTHAIVLLGPGGLPRTTSGKVRRKACKHAFLTQGFSELASSVFGSETIEGDATASGESGSEGQRRPSIAPPPMVAGPRADDALAARTADRVIEWLRRYADTNGERHGDDVLRTLSPSLLREFGEQGLLALQVSTQHGGLGLGHSETARVLEQLAALDMNAGLFVGLNNYLGIGPIARHATPSLKDVLLPRLARGEELAGFAFAEPAGQGNGEQLASYAERVNGSGFRLYGKKYASLGAVGMGVTNVFVSDRDQDGVTAFVVPESASGLRVQASSAVTHGTRSLARRRLVLEGVFVKHEHVLGHKGKGLAIAMDCMAHAHLAVAAACLGGMKRCAQLVFHYATHRQTSTGRLVAHPVTLAKLGRVTAGVTALECLVQEVAAALDTGRPVPSEAFTVCKVVAPEMLWQVVDDLVQLLGRRGYVETPHIRHLVRDAQALRSCEGPTEVVSALLGQHLTNGGDEGIMRFVRDVLHAPEVEPLVVRSRAAVRGRGRGHAAGSEGSYWEQARAGELVTWVALLAAVEGRRRRAPSGELERASTWARAGFERALSALEAEPLGPGGSDDGIMESVSAYSRAVGNVDPLLVWGPQSPHPSVAPEAEPPSSGSRGPSSSARTPSSPTSSVPTPSAPAASSAPTQSGERAHVHYSRQELRAWIVSWLSSRLRVAESQVDPKRSFSDHGLDSLAAVELTKALSDHLGRPLEETLLWSFANIDALVEHLGAAPHDAVRARQHGTARTSPHDATRAGQHGSPPSREHAASPKAEHPSGPATGPRATSRDTEASELEAEIERLERELRRR